jgi:hypothetical protein
MVEEESYYRVGGWRLAAGGARLAAGGWRLAAAARGWADGGWRVLCRNAERTRRDSNSYEDLLQLLRRLT